MCVLGNGSEILGRESTHIFFSGKKYNFMHFERLLPYKMHTIIFFPENLKKILGLTT